MELNIKEYGVFEVDDTFTSLPKNEQENFINKIKNNIDKDKLDSKIAEAKEFEQSTLGKGLDFASKVISAPARVLGVGESVPFSERLERKKQKEASQEERGLTKQEQIKEDIHDIKVFMEQYMVSVNFIKSWQKRQDKEETKITGETL